MDTAVVSSLRPRLPPTPAPRPSGLKLDADAGKGRSGGFTNYFRAGNGGTMGAATGMSPVLSGSDDDLEVGAFHLPQFFVQDGDAFIGSDGDGPFDAVVRHEHSVAFQGGQNDADLGGKA
jgi:hypothetical protein